MKRLSDDMSDTEKWAYAVSCLTLEVKKTIYKNMQQFGLDTNQLYILSANTLLEFIILLQQPQQKDTLRLIHEKVFITNLLKTISEKHKSNSKK
jgi:hypothetical protein